MAQQLMPLNEPLITGFALLRVFQLVNLDVYYINSKSKRQPSEAGKSTTDIENALPQLANSQAESQYSRTILDDLNDLNPLKKYMDRYPFLHRLARMLKICLSLSAVILGFEKLASTILLCLSMKTNYDKDLQTNTNTSMGLFVLILNNFASMHILFSVIFNGHLVWELFSQRLFLVGRKFQQKTMLYLLGFVYLEYLINIAFVNNLYEWDFTSNNIESSRFSNIANLRTFVTEQDTDHYYMDIVLTVFQFARGVIYMTPYITVNYAIICLKEHIYTIRNQHLITDSLKKRHRLRSTIRDKKSKLNNGAMLPDAKLSPVPDEHNKNRQVFFTSDNYQRNKGFSQNQLQPTSLETPSAKAAGLTWEGADSELRSGGVSPNSAISIYSHGSSTLGSSQSMLVDYLDRISDFEELEAYVTSLYIFAGRLNQVVARQGITVFFIVHNLLISTAVLVPESARGGPPMANLIRALLVLMAIVPFILGQMLYSQLDQLSKQIDRLIIQQQFIRNKRDNLVRIRQLVHDIRVGCGGMLNYNVVSGIKYLAAAFATAFFIEQEHYKLTRRH